MESKSKLFIALLVALSLFSGCSAPSESDKLEKIAEQVEQAIPSEYVKQYETETYHLFSAADTEGHGIEYYLCITTYYAADPESVPKLHTDAFASVFDLKNTSLIRELDISGHAAAIYQGAEQNYICCTSSPTASVVMEYDPDAVSEEDAIKTIRSIFEPVVP